MNPTEFERGLVAAFREDLRNDRLLATEPTDDQILEAIRTCDWSPYSRFLREIAYRMPASCGELAQQWLLKVSNG